MASNDGLLIRDGVVEDCVEIRRLMQELADFEGTPDAPKLSVQDLESDGFGESQLFGSLVVQGDGCLLGYALYCKTYTWYGRTLFLEDLYVTPTLRGKGAGRALLSAVAKKAVAYKCKRLDFLVLGWNPAQKFYKSLCAQNVTEESGWQAYRVLDGNLLSLANLS